MDKTTKGRGRVPKNQKDLQSVVISIKLTDDELERLDLYLEKININVRSVGVRKIIFDTIDAYDRKRVDEIE